MFIVSNLLTESDQQILTRHTAAVLGIPEEVSVAAVRIAAVPAAVHRTGSAVVRHTGLAAVHRTVVAEGHRIAAAVRTVLVVEHQRPEPYVTSRPWCRSLGRLHQE